MRRPDDEPSIIHHFSHPHPLQLINPQNLTTQCSGCELQSSGWMYACTDCNFTLHLSCTKMPQLINHQSHPSHLLTLLPTPPYPNGMFTCNGCRRPARGFCFSCTLCNFDVHISCATKPLSLMNHMHAHKLELMFECPYKPRAFSCNICRQLGSINHWLYHCSLCGFDAHLDCASNVANVPQAQTLTQIQMQHYNSYPGRYHQIQNGTFRPGGVNNFAHSQSMGMYQNSLVGTPGVANGNVFVSAALLGFEEGAAQQVGQYVMHSLMDDGSGGGGGDPGGDNGMDFGSSTLGGFFGDS